MRCRRRWTAFGSGLVLAVPLLVLAGCDSADDRPPPPPAVATTVPPATAPAAVSPEVEQQRLEQATSEPPGTVSASGWQNPNEACGYLATEGLSTGAYHAPAGDYFCIGSVHLGDDLPVPNEIHYMPTGVANRITRIQLGAETYNFDSAVDRQTLSQAARIAPTLVTRALGETLPAEAVQAFRSGKTGSWQIGGATVRVEREDHAPGRGYTVYLRIVESS